MKASIFLTALLCLISIIGTVSAVQWKVEYTGDKLPDKDGWTIDTNWEGEANTEIQNGSLLLDTKKEKGYFRYIQEWDMKPDEGVVVEARLKVIEVGVDRISGVSVYVGLGVNAELVNFYVDGVGFGNC